MSDSSQQTHKKDFRKNIQSMLRELSPSQRDDEETSVNNEAVMHLHRQPKGTLLAYASYGIELNIDPVVAFALNLGWRVALPVITDIPNGLMELRGIESFTGLVRGPMGIREPSPKRSVKLNPAEIDIGFIPAWAFDRTTGARLGKGGGFYDRLLAHSSWRASVYGIAFRCQLCSNLPVESHDMSVDGILCPDGLIQTQ